jgi:uncharacterized membrane protein YbhN (UPF0104 family)
VPARAEGDQRRLIRIVESGISIATGPSPSNLGLAADRTPRPIRLVLLLQAIVVVGHKPIVTEPRRPATTVCRLGETVEPLPRARVASCSMDIHRSWLAALTARLRSFARRRRALLTVVGSLVTAAILVFVLAGRREEFTDALGDAAAWVLVLAVVLQIVALLTRSEAWHLSIEAAGGTVERRVLYRASAMGVLGGLLNAQMAVAVRIGALRRSSPTVSPQVPTLIAAEFPILAIEATLAALTSFTLVVPLGLPWWLPIAALALIGAASAGLRHLALSKGRELWRGLAVLRRLNHGSRVVAFVLVAVFAQILRNWLLLHAVGVDASLFDSIAVLIAVVTLSQLPVGPSVGAAAAVLILGSDGVAASAAAGVLLTVTGTIGGLCFLAWAGADRLWVASRRGRARHARRQRSG